MNFTFSEKNIIKRDRFLDMILFLYSFPTVTNSEIYKLQKISKKQILINGVYKRIKVAKKILKIPDISIGNFSYTLEKEEEEQIMGLWFITQNRVIISSILNIQIYLIDKCIERNQDRFTIRHCEKENNYYLSKKLEIGGETIYTPCPYCSVFNEEYPGKVDAKKINVSVVDNVILNKYFDYFRKLKQTIKVYQRIKEKGAFSKDRAKMMKYLYEGLLWIFGETTTNFPEKFTDVCNLLNEKPEKMRDNLLQFLYFVEISVEANAKKRKIENVKIARNLVDFVEIVSYYCTAGGEYPEYFKKKYIQLNIPLLFSIDKI